MKKAVCLAGLFLAFFLPAWVAAKSARKKQDAQSPISRMIAALGGERFLGLTSFQASGRGLLVGKNPVKIDFAQKGEKLRAQIETSFWSSTEAFDGVAGWRRFGAEKPFTLSQSPLALFAENGLFRIQRIEIDSLALGHDTLIEKTPCRWVKSFDSTAGELWIFLDANTFRPKELFSPAVGVTAGTANFQPVGGVWFPHRITVRRGRQNYLELDLDTVLVNPALPDSIFAFPEN